MKKVLFILFPLLLIAGGGGYAMMRFGIPPFKKTAAKGAKPAAAGAPQTAKGNVEPPATAGAQDKLAKADSSPDPNAADNAPPTASDETSNAKKEEEIATQKAAAKLAKAEADKTPDPKSEANLARLASVYEQMPAEDAGKILTKLNDPLVEKMLRRMDENKVAKLLLVFPPDRSAKLTEALSKTP